MIDENELMISNRSYINKDFASIYPELLELTKKLTSKWDPETSNESDPGVVLLKLMAFLGDKLNYNVDKNVLECFMPSATQESSMRKLCDMMGYEMGYFNASEVELTFSCSDDNEYNLKAFDTIISSDEQNGVQFVLRDPVTVVKGSTSTAIALQGNVRSLYILDSSNTTITLDNIDDMNRLYFPVRNVAQNGVFVSNANSSDLWTRRTNLNVVAPNNKVFKFGFDSSRQLPYIEFPVDIANIIGSGLRIRYITTDGVDGNVSRGYLTNIVKADGIDSFDNISVVNMYASFGGANPESIDDAYTSFKRTIGTFETLVSCRDYSNYIYNMLDMYGHPIVSNVQVSDRRDDLNYGTKVLTFADGNEHFINVDTGNFDANQLCLYPLHTFNATSIDSFVQSFKPMLDDATELPYSITQDVEFSDVKTISHDYKALGVSDIYLIKNYASLDARIATTKKVNDVEQAEIINNVLNALIDNFNARKVDYGHEIPYDVILNVIESADNRIGSVSLMEPTLDTRFMLTSGDEFGISNSTGKTKFIDTVARNVLEGKVEVFDFDDSFAFDLGQVNGTVVDNVKSLRTAVKYSLTQSLAKIEKDNVAIQLISPNIVTKTKYSYGVLVKFNSNVSFNANDDFVLSGSQTFSVKYKNSEGEDVNVDYDANTIVRFSSNVVNGVPSGWVAKDGYYIVPADGLVEIRALNSTNVSKTTHCYWIRDNEDNNLFPEGKVGGVYSTILKDNEYFFYASDDYTSMVSLGSGTMIKTSLELNWALGADSKRNFASITSGDITSTANIFVDVPFTSEYPLSVDETSIVTLVKNDFVGGVSKNLYSGSGPYKNDVIALASGEVVEYRFANEDEDVTHRVSSISSSIPSYVVARYDVDTDKDRPQFVDADEFVYVSYGSSTATITNEYMCTNLLCQKAGDSIDLSSYDFTTASSVYPYSVYSYVKNQNAPIVTRNTRGLDVQVIDSNVDYAFPIPRTSKCAIMLYWKAAGSEVTRQLNVTIQGTSASARILNGSSTGTSFVVSDNSFVVIEMTNATSITVNSQNVDGALTIGELRYYTGLNPNLGLTASDESTLLAKIESLSSGKFYYTNRVSDENAIEVEDLSSPYAFFDPNNAVNKFVLEEIDFKNSRIEIMRSSRL